MLRITRPASPTSTYSMSYWQFMLVIPFCFIIFIDFRFGEQCDQCAPGTSADGYHPYQSDFTVVHIPNPLMSYADLLLIENLVARLCVCC